MANFVSLREMTGVCMIASLDMCGAAVFAVWIVADCARSMARPWRCNFL